MRWQIFRARYKADEQPTYSTAGYINKVMKWTEETFLKLELKCFTKQRPHTSCRQRALPTPRHPLAATEWASLLLDDVTRSVRRTPYMHCQWGWWSTFFLFLSLWPWPLTFDLDIQTLPCERPNTSSLWIWRKSVQRFPRFEAQTKKKVTDGAKSGVR